MLFRSLTLTSDEFNFGVNGTSIPKRITNDDWKMKLILLTYKRPFYHIGRLCPATSRKRGGFNHSRVQIIDVVFSAIEWLNSGSTRFLQEACE